MELGLKLWSTNDHLLEEAARLIENQLFAYIELTVVPGTDPALFAGSGLPFVIHAPTERYGVDLGNPLSRVTNRQALEESIQWADLLGADRIILHPGSGSLPDALSFLSGVKDHRVCIENMPRAGIGGENLIGATMRELTALIGGKFGFCLDLNHAVKAASAENLEYHHSIRELLTLSPAIFHLADGHAGVLTDEHLPIGAGDYDMAFLVQCIAKSPSPRVTLETPRTSVHSLAEDRQAAEALARFL